MTRFRKTRVAGALAIVGALALIAAACAAEDTVAQDAAAAASSAAASASTDASSAMAAAQGAQAGADAADARAAAAEAEASAAGATADAAAAAADAAAAAAAEAQAAAELAQATASGSAEAIAEAEAALADASAAAESASAQAAAAQEEAAAAQAEAAAAQEEAAAAQAEAAAAQAEAAAAQEEAGAAQARAGELEAEAAERAAMEEADFMSPGAGVSVTMARASWTTEYILGAIWHHLLEELGYDVSEPADREMAPANLYVAMAQGDIDFWASSWYPLHNQWLAAELPDGSLVREHVSPIGEMIVAGGLQGYLTNKSLVDEYGIKTFDQINADPELIAIYDADDSSPGDGVVQFTGCPEDWTCDDVMDEQIAFAGWDNIAQVKAGYDAAFAGVVAAEAEGKAFITYTWTPSAYVAELVPGGNAIWLAVEESSVLDGSITPEFDQRGAPAAIGPEACSNDPCYLGFTAADVLVTANDEFLIENPAARTLFRLVTISLVDVALQNLRYNSGENTTEDVNRHASEWIEANRAQVDEWLQAAREAAA